jgi:peptidoglycan/xylan/chitin deacetylase (PgdA/CDA1 family)
MLSWAAARELAREGVSFGSHTMTHPRLAGLAPEERAWELEESRRRLEAVLGPQVSVLAYPFGKIGDLDEETRRAARAAGYRAAYTALPGPDPSNADPFALRRVKVRDEPVWRFAIRLVALRRPRPFLDWILEDGDGPSSPGRGRVPART